MALYLLKLHWKWHKVFAMLQAAIMESVLPVLPAPVVAVLKSR
jgi:hypothetical protein